MSKTELSDLKLQQLTEEQRLKITQGIIEDLVRALNLGNYSLVWRYFSDKLSQKFGPEEFTSLHEELTNKYQALHLVEQKSSTLDDQQLSESWILSAGNAETVILSLDFRPIKEFLVIEQLSIHASTDD